MEKVIPVSKILNTFLEDVEDNKYNLEEDMLDSAKTVIEGLALLGGSAVGLATLYYGYKWGKEKVGNFLDNVVDKLESIQRKKEMEKVKSFYDLKEKEIVTRLLANEGILEAIKTGNDRHINSAINSALTEKEREGLAKLAGFLGGAALPSTAKAKATSSLKKKLLTTREPVQED